MTIHFKSGREMSISEEIANKIRDFQLKSDQRFAMFNGDDGNLRMLINAHEIETITQD